jgi:hypothetical protein
MMVKVVNVLQRDAERRTSGNRCRVARSRIRSVQRGRSPYIPAIEALHRRYQNRWEDDLPLMDTVTNDVQNWLGRLCWAYTPKIPIEEAKLVDRLAARRDWMIFMDTNMVTTSVSGFWPELLQQPRRLVFTIPVIDELEDFLCRKPDYPLYRALMDGHESVLVLEHPRRGTPDWIAQQYYVVLMLCRRSTFDTAKAISEGLYGRKLTSDEESTIRSKMQRLLSRERIVLDAKKRSPFLADECLVYYAVRHALTSGQPTMLLSSDFDVAAQFRHLMEVILSHYRAMLIAERYKQEPNLFRPRAIGTNVLGGYFLDEPGVEIDLTVLGPDNPWPSSTPTHAPISCITATPHHVSEMVFNAETEMKWVLWMKANTPGLSTNLLDGRNLHSWTVHLEGIPIGHGIVARDRHVPASDVVDANVGMADVLLSQLGLP